MSSNDCGEVNGGVSDDIGDVTERGVCGEVTHAINWKVSGVKREVVGCDGMNEQTGT